MTSCNTPSIGCRLKAHFKKSLLSYMVNLPEAGKTFANQKLDWLRCTDR
jgi:hypothetical protein